MVASTTLSGPPKCATGVWHSSHRASGMVRRLVSLAMVGGLVVACGSERGAGRPDADRSEQHASVESLDGDERRGGTLRVALTGDLPNLDPVQTTDSMVLFVGGHMFETLFTWDADYRAVPLLAAGHDVSDDGLVHTIRLREGVQFHNGEILDADDVVASVQRWGRVSGLGRELMDVVDEIVPIDDTTVEFRLSEPFGTLAMTLARQLQGCTISPASVLAESTDGELAEYVGTGPYRLVEWRPDQRVLLGRFDGYTNPTSAQDGYAGSKAQYLDQIEFVPVPSEASRVAGLQSGDYHYLETVSPDQVSILERAEGVVVELLPPDSWLNMVLNMRSPVFDDIRVRRAVQVALDHEAIMLAAFGEDAFELTPELVPGAAAWYTEAGGEYFNVNDPERSRELLDEAGYEGEPLRILVTREVQQEYNATLAMAQQLEDVGFSVDVQVVDGATLSSRRNEEDGWEIYAAWASFRPDPVMRNLTCSATGWWCNADKDRLLRALQTESDHDDRFAIWEQVQQAFYEEVPRLKIGNTRRVNALSARLHGIGPTEMQPDFANAWLEPT